MNRPIAPVSRREFARSMAAAAAGAAMLSSTPMKALAESPKIRLGMDNFAVRAMKLKGRELVDYASSLAVDTLFITDLPSLGSLKETDAAELRRYAQDKGVEILLGSWSICPTSKTFRKDWGTAEEHLALGLKLSKALGSFAFRVWGRGRIERRREASKRGLKTPSEC